MKVISIKSKRYQLSSYNNTLEFSGNLVLRKYLTLLTSCNCKALYPTAILLGVSPEAAIAAFAAVSALFILPTYPTLIAAVEMDDTGSTRIGKYVFNHPFLIPGVIAISLSVLFGFLMAGAVL